MTNTCLETALANMIQERSQIGNLVRHNVDTLFEIVPNVFLGNFNSTLSPLSADIDLIVNCTKDLPFPPPPPAPRTAARMDMRLPINDDRSKEAFDTFIEKAPELLKAIEEHVQCGKKVLVHCLAGQQRSCALVAAYLMFKKGFQYDKAVSHIKSIKADAFFYGVNFEYALAHLTDLKSVVTKIT